MAFSLSTTQKLGCTRVRAQRAPVKRNAQAPGSWSLETAAGGVVASGELQFPAHFREAAFEVDAPAVDGAPYVLAVADVDGHSASRVYG